MENDNNDVGGDEDGENNDGEEDEKEDDEEDKNEDENEDDEEKEEEFVDPLDGEFALTPETKSFFGTTDNEPIDPDNKIFKSPVFIVNPKFSNPHCKPEDDQLFHNHYYGGYKQPKH